MIKVFKETYKTIFSKLTVSIWALATFGTVMAGPFGTFSSMTFRECLIFWPLVTTSSIFLGYLAYAITRVFFGFEETSISRLLVGTLGSVFITTDVIWISAIVMPNRQDPLTFFPLFGWVSFVFFSVLVGRVMFQKAIETRVPAQQVAQPTLGPQGLGIDDTPVGAVPESAVPVADRLVTLPRLLERLPKGNHEQVFRLSANDHFVHIITKEGEHPVRMRLRDAIAEMGNEPGALVHRSHWVADRAIDAIEKEQGKMYLRLLNGDRVPVSRNYRDRVENLNISVARPAAKPRSEASVQ